MITIVVCLITFNDGWGFSPEQHWYKAASVAACQEIAAKHHHALTGNWYVYHLPKDQEEFEVRCGKDGKDCLDK